MTRTTCLAGWLVLCASCLVWAEDPVHFADANLKAAIEAQLGVSDPTPTDMLALTELAARELGIAELTGIEHAGNLQELFLYGNQISDISTLSGLDKLMWLDLDNNEITDISALAGLTRLVWLDLDDNQISDISALSACVNLAWLDLDNNQITDISALAGLGTLTSLDLAYNPLSDITALSGLSNLEKLGLENSQIEDISALAGLTKLSMLWVHDNPLNQQACDIHLPRIIANNPGCDIRYDACTSTQYHLKLSSSMGGSVTVPGEGSFAFDQEVLVPVSARADDACYYFLNWTGTAVDAAIVNDPNDPNTVLNLTGNHTLQANFRALTIHVDDDAPFDPGPSDPSISDPLENGTQAHPFDSIQEAIDIVDGSCAPVVLVRAGTYDEAINFMGKRIRVTGIDPETEDTCPYPVIAAPAAHATVTFHHGEDSSSQLSGFVLTHGHGQTGPALECIGSSPAIKNCLFVGNRNTQADGAIIYCQDSHSLLENCTIADNDAGTYGAALYSVDSKVTIANSIIWGNSPRQILVESGDAPLIVCSDVQDAWPGIGNIAVDPEFAAPGFSADPNDPAAVWLPGDYHLMSENGHWDMNSETWVMDGYTSPCVGAGDQAWFNIADPNHHREAINMGAYGATVQASRWRIGPIARWTFAESSGNTAADSVGDSHGTVYGAAWTPGILDGALEFDGIDDYVDCGNDPTLAPDQFTISMWVYSRATSGSRTILRKAGGDADKDYEFELFAARHPTFSFGNGAQAAVLYASSQLPLNEWVHVTLTRSESEAAININGIQSLKKAYGFTLSPTQHNLIIGGAVHQPYQGKVDDLRIYDTVLSQEDILALAKAMVAR